LVIVLVLILEGGGALEAAGFVDLAALGSAFTGFAGKFARAFSKMAPTAILLAA